MILSLLALAAAAPVAVPATPPPRCHAADGRKIIVQGGSPVSAASRQGPVALGPKPDDPSGRVALGPKPDDPSGRLATGPKPGDPAAGLRIGPKQDDPAHPNGGLARAEACRGG